MKTLDLRKLSMSELQSKIKELEEKLFSSSCNTSMGTASDTSVLRKNRRLIARSKTILNEKCYQST